MLLYIPSSLLSFRSLLSLFLSLHPLPSFFLLVILYFYTHLPIFYSFFHLFPLLFFSSLSSSFFPPLPSSCSSLLLYLSFHYLLIFSPPLVFYLSSFNPSFPCLSNLSSLALHPSLSPIFFAFHLSHTI